LGKKTMKESDI